MFTGIIESMATIASLQREGSNIHFFINSSITHELKEDQSVAHNGVCLTVVGIKENVYQVTAIAETLAKTSLGTWQAGDELNIERALKLGDRLDGHFVQGHADGIATCISMQPQDGSWLYRFSIPQENAALVIEKGSICLNGVSLTVFNVSQNECSVAIIPYTYTHTNFHSIEKGSVVNVEYDVLGKYLLRQRQVG